MIRKASTYIWDLSITISIYNLSQPINATIIPAAELETKAPVGRQEWPSNNLRREEQKHLSSYNKHKWTWQQQAHLNHLFLFIFYKVPRSCQKQKESPAAKLQISCLSSFKITKCVPKAAAVVQNRIFRICWTNNVILWQWFTTCGLKLLWGSHIR